MFFGMKMSRFNLKVYVHGFELCTFIKILYFILISFTKIIFLPVKVITAVFIVFIQTS